MGIGAAKRIEQRFLDVAALRAQPADAVMSRFRRDAHEAVDIILDIVTAAATTVGERAGRVVNVTAGHATSTTSSRKREAPDESGMRLAAVRIKGNVKPGSVGELTMSLENESDQTTAEFTLHAAELVSASGARIPSDRVAFDPATLSVGPRASGQVSVKVSVPARPPGVRDWFAPRNWMLCEPSSRSKSGEYRQATTTRWTAAATKSTEGALRSSAVPCRVQGSDDERVAGIAA
jgi:hypothetical protein